MRMFMRALWSALVSSGPNISSTCDSRRDEKSSSRQLERTYFWAAARSPRASCARAIASLPSAPNGSLSAKKARTAAGSRRSDHNLASARRRKSIMARPWRVGAHEGGVACKIRFVVIGAEDHPFHQLAARAVVDLIAAIRCRFDLAAARQPDGVLQGVNVRSRRLRRRRVGEGSAGRARLKWRRCAGSRRREQVTDRVTGRFDVRCTRARPWNRQALAGLRPDCLASIRRNALAARGCLPRMRPGRGFVAGGLVRRSMLAAIRRAEGMRVRRQQRGAGK